MNVSRGAIAALLLTASAILPARSSAQATIVPDYAPLSPTVSLRSGLSSFGYRDAHAGWRVGARLEYGSAAEHEVGAGSMYVLDAELMRAGIIVERDVAARTFVHLQAGVTGSYDGFADGFFDAFHRLIRYEQEGREARPTNEFAYEIRIGGADDVVHDREPLAVADVRAGIGRRHSARLQSFASVTLPTGSGMRRGVPSFALVHTARGTPGARVQWEASLGMGYTPTHGALADVQRTWLASASGAARADVWRGHALYASLFYHSAVYRGTGLDQLDRGELSTEFGVLVKARGREWRVGMVEDLRYDAGIDLVLKVEAAY